MDRGSPQNIRPLLEECASFFDEFSRRGFDPDRRLDSLIPIAFVKSYEFALSSQREELDDAFFHAATLRGICEDLIALAFLATLSTDAQNDLLESVTFLDLHEKATSQNQFFSTARPFQPGIRATLSEEAVRNFRTQADAVRRDVGWPYNAHRILPSVNYMARESGYSELYQYLYNATSDWVHFKPRMLMRMGWGDRETFHFSTQNFSGYYALFARFYSLYLFLEFCRRFNDRLDLSGIRAPIDALSNEVTETLRWPELVTFEEMNVEGPPDFSRLMYMLMYRHGPGNGAA